MNTEILGVIAQIVLMVVLAYPIGKYISKVFKGEKVWSDFMTPIEKIMYKLGGVDPTEEMNWKQFLKALLVINLFWFFWGMILLVSQGVLPLNPDGNLGQSVHQAFNTCISFLVNCNLQHYSGESGLSYLTQLFVIMLFQFITAATGMAAMTKSELTIKNVSHENLGIIPDSFRRLGIKMEQRGDDIHVPAQDTYQIESFIDGSIMTIADAPWPGLTPDLLSVLLVVATQAKGSVLIHQKMFESRLFFVDKLIDMGAQIILCDPHRAVVIGHNHGFKLRGGNMTSPDIRAGIALLIAAMSADGISRIHNIEQIDRGYQNIEGRLNALGARITRI